MPRNPHATSPEELIIGYFVTRPLDRVQDMLSHVQTIVRSRVRHAPQTGAGEANSGVYTGTGSTPGTPVRNRSRKRAGVAATMPAASAGVNHRADSTPGTPVREQPQPVEA